MVISTRFFRHPSHPCLQLLFLLLLFPFPHGIVVSDILARLSFSFYSLGILFLVLHINFQYVMLVNLENMCVYLFLRLKRRLLICLNLFILICGHLLLLALVVLNITFCF